jgi:hypothetical protein
MPQQVSCEPVDRLRMPVMFQRGVGANLCRLLRSGGPAVKLGARGRQEQPGAWTAGAPPETACRMSRRVHQTPEAIGSRRSRTAESAANEPSAFAFHSTLIILSDGEVRRVPISLLCAKYRSPRRHRAADARRASSSFPPLPCRIIDEPRSHNCRGPRGCGFPTHRR